MRTAVALFAILPVAHAASAPVGAVFEDQTFDVLLQDIDPSFPPLILNTASWEAGGGVVEVGLSIDVADAGGDQTCSFGLVEASRRPNAFWLDGPYCDPESRPNFSEWLFGVVECSPCDWTDGYPSEVMGRTDIRGVYIRYRPDTNTAWTYGWVAYQAIELENLTCNPDCEGFGATVPFINFIAAGFDTEQGSPLPVGAGLCDSDLNFDGVLDLADIQLFVENFGDSRSLADRNADGVYDLADLQAFIAAFVAGCP